MREERQNIDRDRRRKREKEVGRERIGYRRGETSQRE